MTFFNGVEVPVADQMKFYDAWGSQFTYPHMAVGWTWAMSTPYKWTKQVPSYFGGIRNGMAIAWPGHIGDPGGIRNQFHHVIDIVPTILEATGIRAPQTVDGITQTPIEGVSLAYTFDKANANAPSAHKTQYFEMFGNRALYHDGWMASTVPYREPWNGTAPTPKDVVNGVKWELFDLTKDWNSEPRRVGEQSRRSSRSCKTCSGSRPPSIRCCRSMPRHSHASFCHDPASWPAARSSPTPSRLSACRWARRRACSTSPSLSPRTSKYRRRRQRHARHSRRPLRGVGVLPSEGEAGLCL